MLPHVKVMVSVLLEPFGVLQLGEEDAEYAVVAHRAQRPGGVRPRAELPPLLKQALGGDGGQAVGDGKHGIAGVGINFQPQAAHEAVGAQHAGRVIAEGASIHHAQQAVMQIAQAVEGIEQAAGFAAFGQTEGHSIEGEVAPAQVAEDVASAEAA
ncbi:MAG: hypothetical protein BWY76_02290 [bacterium ADurb.Bin429]|nr:MAG: hypothetical protein BWY76_02290 [bacterium ADurb.Bin429]